MPDGRRPKARSYLFHKVNTIISPVLSDLQCRSETRRSAGRKQNGTARLSSHSVFVIVCIYVCSTSFHGNQIEKTRHAACDNPHPVETSFTPKMSMNYYYKYIILINEYKRKEFFYSILFNELVSLGIQNVAPEKQHT